VDHRSKFVDDEVPIRVVVTRPVLVASASLKKPDDVFWTKLPQGQKVLLCERHARLVSVSALPQGRDQPSAGLTKLAPLAWPFCTSVVVQDRLARV